MKIVDEQINLAANDPQAKAVERPIQNYLFNALTKNAMAWQSQSRPAWYVSKPGGYEKNAEVVRLNSGTMTPYRSMVDANITDPLTNPASWEPIPFAFELIKNVPMPLGGSQGPATSIISAATDFNTFANGTWTIKDAATAALCPNAPFIPGQAVRAGSLEAIRWITTGAQFSVIQRYVDTAGNIFVRSAWPDLNSFGAWVIQVSNPYLQSGAQLYAVTGGTGAAYTINLSPNPGALTDGMEIRARIHLLGTGAATLSLNGLPAKQIVGTSYAPIKAGTLQAGSVATFRYQANNDCFVIMNLTGGYLQGLPARNDDEIPNWGQVKAYVASSQPTSIPWSIITDKPDIVYTSTNATLKTIDLVDAQPWIDFHYNNDVADYNMRIINDGDKVLRIFAKGNASAIAAIGDTGVNVNRQLNAALGLYVGYNQIVNFNNSVAGLAYYFAWNDTNWYLNYTPSNGAGGQTSLYMVRSTGQLVFSIRPSFGDQTPWDTGNFNPANYILKGANAGTNVLGLSYASGLDIGNYTGGNQSQIMLDNAGNGTPAVGLLRSGVYGAYIGMAANNQPFWGGWSAKSDGSNGYLVTSWNWGAWYQILMPGMAVYYVGAYMLAMQVDGGPAHGIGELVSAAGCILCAVSGANGGQRPNAGTLRCMGYSQGSGISGASITLWQRVA